MMAFILMIWSQIILLTLVVFAVSSGFLYSDGPKELRDWYFEKTSTSEYWFIKKLSHLAMCQLCCSVWFAAVFQFFLVNWINFPTYIAISFSVAGVSWLLGGMTRFFLWGAAFFQRNME